MHPSLLKLLAIALFSVLAMSFVPILIRSTQANEVTIGVVRLLIALVCITPFILAKRGNLKLAKSDWINLFIIGLIFGAHWLTYFIAIKWSAASLAALALCTYGIHLLVLNWFFKRSTVLPIDWIAVIVCFIGCLLITPSLSIKDKQTLGLLIGVSSGFLYACLPLLHQRIMHVPAMTRAWAQFAFASLVFVPFLGQLNFQLNSIDWWSLLALGIVCTVIGHSLWVKVSAELPAILTGVSYYMYVPIALTMSFFLLDEVITTKVILGAILIVGANISIAILAWRRTNTGSKRALSDL